MTDTASGPAQTPPGQYGPRGYGARTYGPGNYDPRSYGPTDYGALPFFPANKPFDPTVPDLREVGVKGR